MFNLRKIFMCVLAFLCAFTGTAFAYNGNLEDISLSVMVERKVNPDIAYVNYSILGTGASSKLAAEEATIKAAKVKTALLKNNITSSDLEQISYKLNPLYNDKHKLVGYNVVNVIKVRVEQLEKLGEVIDVLSANDVDAIGNISYTIKNMDSYQEMLLQEAIRTARRKAAVLAGAGGRNLGRLLTIRVNSYSTVPRMANVAMMKNVASTEGVATVIEHKDIDLRAEIEAVFALE